MAGDAARQLELRGAVLLQRDRREVSGGFFGWPNFTAIPRGGVIGMPASSTPANFRVLDLYRRAGDKLAEDWVFIDVLHALKTQGLDDLGRGGQQPTSLRLG